MIEIINILQKLTHDFEIIKSYVLSLKNTSLDHFQNTWIDGQQVMQSMRISNRTLQSLRDNSTLPYSRINGKFYYKISDIERLIDSNYKQSKPKRHGNR